MQRQIRVSALATVTTAPIKRCGCLIFNVEGFLRKGQQATRAPSLSVFFDYFFARAKKCRAAGMTKIQAFA